MLRCISVPDRCGSSETMCCVVFQFLIGVVVLRCLLPPSARKMKWIVSAGLAQVSEFSFMLGSRARRLGLVSREVGAVVFPTTTVQIFNSCTRRSDVS